MTLGGILLVLLIFVVLCWIASLLPVPKGAPPWTRNMYYLVVALICLAWLFDMSGHGLGLHKRIF